MTGLTPARTGLPTGMWLAFGLVAALIGLALLRVVLWGWAPLAPDDARYLYVGLSILDGDGPVNPNGSVFLLRSPIYGLALATGSTLVGGDPLVGARIVAVAFALLGLVGALRLGWLLAGSGGAIGTALALVATALVWRLLPSLRIDLVQAALIVATLLAVWRPTTRRWALGGVVLGITILVKETALPLVILPVALVGSVPPARLARLAGAFFGMAVVTAAWWWIVVWSATGQLFPLNALSVIEARDVEVPLRLARSTIPILAAVVAGWGLVAWRCRHDPGARLLLVAAFGLVPAAIYAAALGLNARNFAGLALLSAVAVGAGGAWLVGDLAARRGARPTGHPDVVATVALVAVVVIALAIPVIGQRDAGRPAPDQVADDLAVWLSANLQDDDRIVMAFRDREAMALRQFGRAEVAVLPITRVDPEDAPDDYLWMGLRDQQLFGYRRSAWTAALTDPPADLLILVVPHPFTPSELTVDRDTPARLGLRHLWTVSTGDDRAEIFRVQAEAVASGAAQVPLHLSAEAATAWLDLVGGEAARLDLMAARPVVSGDDSAIRALVDRLGLGACDLPVGGPVRLGSVGGCPD